jgi:SGNH hydrolase-like domain, acetyltransferase AlgX
MKLIARQKIWLAVVVVTNLLLWIIPSDVIELIARDRQTMLGRYSRTHFYWIVGVAIVSAISFYIDWSTGATYKKRWFQVIAILMFLTPSLAVVDFLLRRPEAEHYVRDVIAYHRPADAVFRETFVDRPTVFRTYPDAPNGYGTVECELHTDARGYRNQGAGDAFEIVAIGDSFTEGSGVSDQHPWPTRLASMRKTSVYNAGMSGYDPLHYREALRETALSLRPKIVICMIYEGNDFRSAKTDAKRSRPSMSKRFKAYMKQSPILTSIDDLLINTFGPIRANAPIPDTNAINWMPLSIPPGPSAKRYAFAPKQMRDMYESRERFSQDKHWLNPRKQIADMNELCQKAGISFVLVFAPTKAHVTLPLVADRVSAEQFRDFLALRKKKTLPAPEEFKERLMTNLDAREQVVGDWCMREGIPFVTLTMPLREAAQAGTQVYYTYDQHWTPKGHDIVAQTLADFLRSIEKSSPPAGDQ